MATYCRLKSDTVMVIDWTSEATEEFYCYPLGLNAESLVRIPFDEVDKVDTSLKFLKMFRY